MRRGKRVLLAGLVLSMMPTLAMAEEVVIYSARKDHLIKPLLDAYKARTGVEGRFLSDDAAPLTARLKAEGANTPADLLLTVDVGNLWNAAQEGVLQEVQSEVLDKNVPAHLRDPGHRWFGVTVRARTLVYHTERVKPEQLSTYENLADAAWKGKLCLRSSKKVYNQSLVAMLIARLGLEKTEAVVKGWVANLADAPFANDTKVMEAILAGQCDVGIVNTYYFGELQEKRPDMPLALYWPNQKESGVHINVSGAGVTAHARNRAGAVKLLEWFTTEEAQRLFADLNKEYPVNAAVAASPSVSAWGRFKADEMPLVKAGEHQADAVMLMDRVGYK
ncbi:MAG: extracellular solute-binding protein [Magnetococcales bacterium]|nr:extracellular solute-binding protein [Magnetococcales bacterium]